MDYTLINEDLTCGGLVGIEPNHSNWTLTPYLGGFVKEQWNGTDWIEGATPEEIAEAQAQTPAVRDKKDYYAILTYDASAPTVPIVDEQINEFGAITVTFDDLDGEIILDSTNLFVDTNVIIQNILPPLGDPLETCWVSAQTDSQIIIQFLTNTLSINPNWFIGSANFKIKLEKYVTP